jgi:hypothetical protein
MDFAPTRLKSPGQVGQPFAFAVVVDEAIALYRRHWRPLVWLSALWYVPTTLLDLAPFASAFANPSTLFTPRETDFGAQDWISFVAGDIIFTVLGAAITFGTVDLLAGRPMSLRLASRSALRRAPSLTLALALWLLALTLVCVASLPLLLVAAIGLGGVVPLILLVVWFVRPHQRERFLKWLIVYMTPFGVLTYYAVRWSLWGQLIVLERLGATAALRRSSELVSGRWFQAAVVTGLVTLLTALIGVAPWMVVSLVLQAAGVTQGLTDTRPVAQLISVLVSIVPGVFVMPIAPIALTLLALHLRNAREGTDLSERLLGSEPLVQPAT